MTTAHQAHEAHHVSHGRHGEAQAAPFIASFEGPKHSNLQPVPRLALNVKEACLAIGVSWDVWKAHIEPEVRLVRVGARKVVPVAELERWLADHAETVLERR